MLYSACILLVQAVIPALVVGVVHARISSHLHAHAKTQRDSRRAQRELARNRRTTLLLSGEQLANTIIISNSSSTAERFCSLGITDYLEYTFNYEGTAIPFPRRPPLNYLFGYRPNLILLRKSITTLLFKFFFSY